MDLGIMFARIIAGREGVTVPACTLEGDFSSAESTQLRELARRYFGSDEVSAGVNFFQFAKTEHSFYFSCPTWDTPVCAGTFGGLIDKVVGYMEKR